MKIISGQLPEGSAWRVLLCLDPENPSSPLWQIGLALAKANGGEMIPILILAEDQDLTGAVQTRLPKIVGTDAAEVAIHPVIFTSSDYHQTLVELIRKVGVDLLLVSADMAEQQAFRQLPCMVGVLHHAGDDPIALQSILVPTSGSLNTAHRLRFLMPLTDKISITTLYVANNKDAGFNEQRKAQLRLNRLLNYVDGGDNVQAEDSHG